MSSVSFCAQHIILIVLSVWATPLMLLFCFVNDEALVPKTVNFEVFDIIGEEGNTAEDRHVDFDGG